MLIEKDGMSAKDMKTICQTLSVKVEELNFQVEVSKEKNKRFEVELSAKEERILCYL